MRDARRADTIALAILASLITLLFLDVLLGANSLYIRDLVHYSYPGKKILREVVLGGEFPYWNRWIAGGQPLAANPASEVFYPLTWLVLLPSYDLGFRLFVLAHLYIAAFSMYALLRSLRLGAPAAFFGAVAFALGGVCLSLLNLLPFLASVAWLPATCLFVRRFLLHRTRRDFVLAAVFLAVQVVIGEPVTLLQTGLILAVYAVGAGWRVPGAGGSGHTGDSSQEPQAPATRHPAPIPTAARNLIWLAAIVAVALLTAAAQFLPALDHASDSVRGRGLSFRDTSDWSMPLVRAGELLYPKLLGHHMLEARRVYWGGRLYPDRGAPFLYSIYPGLMISVLALGGLFARVRGARLVLALVGISLLLALGAHTPLWRVLHDLGVMSSFRFPEKFILTAVVALIVFGAVTLDRLLAGDERVRKMTMRVVIATTAFAAAWAFFALTPFYAPLFARLWSPSAALLGEIVHASRNGWIVAAVSGLLLFILLRNVERLRRPLWLALAGVFVLLDLGALLPELAPRIERAYYDDPPAVLRQLPPQRGDYRIFHQAAWLKAKPEVAPYFAHHPDLYWVYRNGVFPMIPATYGVQTAIDVDIDLTSLQATADFNEAAWALSRWRRDWADVAASMSNVWFRAVYADPREAFARAGGDRRVLQPVGMLPFARYPRYYFADRVEAIRDQDEFVRKLASRQFAKGTAFVASVILSGAKDPLRLTRGGSFAPLRMTSLAPGRVLAVRETANRATLDVETAGPAFLVISVTPHKYWTITVDGAEAEAVVTNVGYQGVMVPAAGRHTIEMRYRNPLIPLGGAVSAITLLVLAFFYNRRGE